MRRWIAVQCRAKRKILEAPSTRGPGRRLRATDAGQLRATIQHHPNGLPEYCPIHSAVPLQAHFAWPPTDPMASIIPSWLHQIRPRTLLSKSCPYCTLTAQKLVWIHSEGRNAPKTKDDLLGSLMEFSASQVSTIIYFLNVWLLPPTSFLNFLMLLGAVKDLA